MTKNFLNYYLKKKKIEFEMNNYNINLKYK